MEPRISVIVPIYKVETYLCRCLDSIVNQSYRNLEIILVDDGSPDGCAAICDRYAKTDKRIQVIHQKNQGVSAARNEGLANVTGRYIMFVDPDDWIIRDAVKILYDRLVKDDSDMAIGQVKRIWANGVTADSYCSWMEDMLITGEEALAMVGTNRDIPCYPVAKLYKSDIFSDLSFPRLCRGEDVWILPHILMACDKISLISQVIYFYFQHAASIVHSDTDRPLLDSISASVYLTRVLLERELYENARSYFCSGIYQGLNVDDTKSAAELIQKGFSREETSTLLKGCWRHQVYLTMLQIPGLCKWLRSVRGKPKKRKGVPNG